MSVIWKKIPNYDGIYEVNNVGQIRNTTSGKVLKQHENPLGYKFIRLSKNGVSKKYRVHRLVAICFLENPENKPFINHLDSNPRNNQLDNLQWCTQSENIQHAYDHGNKTPTKNRIGSKMGTTSKYHNVYLDRTRNRWIANIDVTTSKGFCKHRKFFSISRFKDSDQAEKAAAYAVNQILESIQDTERKRNNVILTESGDFEDADIKTFTD